MSNKTKDQTKVYTPDEMKEKGINVAVKTLIEYNDGTTKEMTKGVLCQVVTDNKGEPTLAIKTQDMSVDDLMIVIKGLESIVIQSLMTLSECKTCITNGNIQHPSECNGTICAKTPKVTVH